MGKLLAAGSNATAQLATGNTEDCHTWTDCSFSLPVRDLATGAGHTLVLAEDGSVWVSGDTSKDQLGGEESCTSLRRFTFPAAYEDYQCVGVSACWETSFFHMKSQDSTEADVVLSCGQNAFGELGRPHQAQSDQLDKVEVDAKQATFKHVIAGMRHALAVASGDISDAVLGWGAANKGQLGQDRLNKPKADQPAPDMIYVPTPGLMSLRLSTTSAAVGKDHTVLLFSPESLSFQDNQYIYTMGSDKHGQKCTAAPYAHSEGWNIISVKDLLASLTLHDDYRPVSVHCTWNGTYILVKNETDSKVISYGANGFGQLGHDDSTSIVNLPNTQSIACGSEHVLATVLNEGVIEVWGWGWNEHGNLGHLRFPHSVKPEKLWSGAEGQEVKVFAGNGTSWIAVS